MLERTSTAGAGATGSLVRGNSINHFWEDAFRCKISNCTIEYNTAVNSYQVVPPGTESDPPHRDMFQSYRGDGSFTAISNVVVRGNVFISRQGTRYTKVPFQVGSNYTIQGIGCFDGPYSNWTIENNVVMVEVGLAMGLYGMDNSRIVNNTVVPNPSGTASEIRIVNEKGGSPSDNDTIRNNLTHTLNIGAATNAHQSNNIAVSAYTTYFVNYGACDVHLKSGSPAINAGTATDAPAIDADKAARVAPYDIGAYEFGAVVPVTSPALKESNPRNQTTIALTGTTLRITTPFAQAMTIEMVTLDGKIAGRYKTNGQNIHLDLSTYARGAYCVLMHSASGTMEKRIFLAE
jgi:hypothetical protein